MFKILADYERFLLQLDDALEKDGVIFIAVSASGRWESIWDIPETDLLQRNGNDCVKCCWRINLFSFGCVELKKFLKGADFYLPGSATHCLAMSCAPTEPDVRNYRIRFLNAWFRYV